MTVFTIIIGVTFASSQQNYWQQQVNYKINVTLNDSAKTLDGFEKITYYNHSPDTLTFIWFHIWPNAYKNDKTAYAEQTLQNGSTRFYFSNEDEKGYLNQLEFRVNGVTSTIETHPKHIDIIKLILPKPIAPNASAEITTPFFVKLPYNFSRGGFNSSGFQVTQWYPKPAVYDKKGWHEMPYLDQGEFYSNFGNFEVQITLPDTYIVAATGELQNTEAINKLKQLGKMPVKQQPNFTAFEEAKKKKTVATKAYAVKPTVTKTTPIKKPIFNLVSYTYKQDNCHDFAWFASKDFIVQYDTLQLTTKTIDVFSYYRPEQINAWSKSIGYAKDGIQKYSNWIGEYPYNIVSVVGGQPNEVSGGMEYPTITQITSNDEGQLLDAVIVHEIGHNWFYGILASNERDHAWMDEGMNTFYQKKYEAEKYGKLKVLPIADNFIQRKLPDDVESLILRTYTTLKKDLPIDAPNDSYNSFNYFLSVYEKGAQWMAQLEKDLGSSTFDACMKQYFEQCKFKHPYPTDFKAVVETTSKTNIDKRFNQLYTTGPLYPVTKKKEIKPVAFFSLKNTEQYNYISIMPIIGGNFYDKISAGFAIHNYQLPLNKFQFFVAPIYATGSKQLNYSSRFSYNTHKKRSWLEISASAMKFAMDDFQPANAAKIFQNVIRFTPSVKYTLYNKDVRSKQRWIFQARSFLLNEEGLSFKTTNSPGGPIDVVNKVTINTQINQIKITTSDNKVLYPYELNLTIDQGKDFVRAGFTANYHLNYANRKGGIDARFFAGKFFYTSDKTFIKQYETDRYHLNMSGARGYEDYTYSNYFFGRNEFEGWQSQQIMQRDGFFKVRTDLLSNKIGKTDDWLTAINLSGNIPDAINILNVLPIKIPLKFFADVGTYADAWKDNPASGKFLYNAGLQLPLINGLVNIYVPILYSKVYGNYFKSTLGENRFWKTISFSIDIQKLQINKLSRDLPL